MRAIFHHAYFVPWLGYFSKLEVADALVVLDAAKFRRNHIKRVSIIGTHGGPEWFTLPVGNNWSVPCNEIVLPAGPDYVTKLLRTLKLSYGRAAAFKEEFADFEILFSRTYFPGRDIVAANIQAITELRRRWTSSTTTILIASQYSQAADRDQRMIEICWHLGIREIVAGDGSMLRVHDLARIKRAGIRVLHYPFKLWHPTYTQVQRERLGKPFVSGLSAVDAIFNVGSARIPELLWPPNLKLENL